MILVSEDSNMVVALVMTVLAFGAIQSQNPGEAVTHVLVNGDFESASVAHGWQVVSYGAEPVVERDEKNPHSGKASLHVSSRTPSDTALGQELELEADRLFRFTGWVKTRGLDPLDSNVSGTFQVQHAGGGGVIASGPSLKGDNDWKAIRMIFKTPGDGRVRIAPFFVGYGKGTGEAWFDDVGVEPIDASTIPIVFKREPLHAEPISRLQYGQFIEYLCDLVPSMWADKLTDGGFEGLSPYTLLHYIKETDNRQRPWRPWAATNRGTYTLDKIVKYGGESSMRIVAEAGIPSTLGIIQDGLAVDQAVPCQFSCMLKQDGLKKPVRVLLFHDNIEYAACEFEPTDQWKKYTARLAPSGGDRWASIAIEFHGPGTLWIDSATLMPEDAVGGWRSDVVSAVREMKPGVIRFGGSAIDSPEAGDFEWKNVIGEPEKRKPLRAWGGLQPFGAGLEEIVQFCKFVGAEPLICVRINQRPAKDAADEIEYFNGPADSPFGSLRAKNGHPDPYHIRYWQIGNEQGGPEYERRLPEFCKAMKEVDPSIELLSSYPSPGVLKGSGEWLSFVAPHHYDCTNIDGCESDFNSIRKLQGTYAPDRKIRVAVTEWNTTAGDAGPRRARLWTLENALACSRYHNLMHRNSDLVFIANRSNIVNSFCSGFIQTDDARLYKTPTYYAQKLYSTLSGELPLTVESELPVKLSPDVSATLTKDGKQVVVFAVNDSFKPVSRPLDFSAFGDSPSAIELWTLGDSERAGEPDVTNSFARSDRVTPVLSLYNPSSSKFEFTFPPLSLTVMIRSIEPRR